MLFHYQEYSELFPGIEKLLSKYDSKMSFEGNEMSISVNELPFVFRVVFLEGIGWNTFMVPTTTVFKEDDESIFLYDQIEAILGRINLRLEDTGVVNSYETENMGYSQFNSVNNQSIWI